MGRYTTLPICDEDYKKLIATLKSGYEYNGVKHRPNKRIATILQVESNLGIRLSDVLNLTPSSIVWDGTAWTLDIIEKKTKKARHFIVPEAVKQFIDNYCFDSGISDGAEKIFKITESTVWQLLRPACAYLGLHDISTHSMRKRAALNLYEASGKDIALVQQWLQHTSPNTTARYLQRSTKAMEDAIEKIVSIA